MRRRGHAVDGQGHHQGAFRPFCRRPFPVDARPSLDNDRLIKRPGPVSVQITDGDSARAQAGVSALRGLDRHPAPLLLTGSIGSHAVRSRRRTTVRMLIRRIPATALRDRGPNSGARNRDETAMAGDRPATRPTPQTKVDQRSSTSAMPARFFATRRQRQGIPTSDPSQASQRTTPAWCPSQDTTNGGR